MLACCLPTESLRLSVPEGWESIKQKKSQSKRINSFLAGVEGLEPSRTVLEVMSYKKTVQFVPTAPLFVLLALLNLMPFDALLMLCKNLIKFDTQLPKNRHSYFYLSITYIPWNCNCNQTKLPDLRMAEWNEQNYSTNKIKRNTKRFWANYGKILYIPLC